MSVDWHRFVSANARAAVDDIDGAPAFLSGRVLAAAALTAPLLEMPARRASSLVGYLRACRQQAALPVVSVDAELRLGAAEAAGNVLKGIAAAAASARVDGPIVVVARAPREGLPLDGPIEALLAGDIAAGFGVVGCLASFIDGDAAAAAALFQLAEEHGVGLDLELVAGDDVDRLVGVIGQMDRPGPGRPTLRGVGVVAPGGPLPRVVDLADVTRLRGPLPPGSRVAIDAITTAITGSDDDVEVRTWLEVSRLLRALGAAGSGRALDDALAVPGHSEGGPR